MHGAGVSVGEVTHVALRHTVRPNGSELVVDTLYGEARAPGDAPFHAALHLGGVGDDDGRWQPWPVPVDGREQVFWLRAVGERWAAFARVGGVRVVVAATRWDRARVGLAAVRPQDYVAGSTTRR